MPPGRDLLTAGVQHDVDVVVVGGGQAGLAAGYHLRRAGFEPGAGYVIVDAAGAPGGAWPHMWDSLRLFSPPGYSSLPGWQMPGWTGDGGFPPARHVVDYLTRYERRYELPVERDIRVHSVSAEDDDPAGRLLVTTDSGVRRARAVVSTTGTWTRPFVPMAPGREEFGGRQLHTVDYRRPGELAGQHVVVVGGGNSAAQVLAEVSTVARTTWVTARPPRFLPDDVDGRVLFQVATRRRKALDAGHADTGGVGGLGDIVMVPSVRDARDRGVLVARPTFDRLTATGVAWADGTGVQADAVIWCTGFRPALRHLAPMRPRSRPDRRIHMLGYGDWTGPASATLVGVGRTARDAVAELAGWLPRRRVT